MRDARRQNCLSQLFLVLYLTQTATPDSSIDMAVVEDSSTLSLRVTMPLHLKMTIKLLAGAREHPVNLTLRMNKNLNEQRTIYVPRQDRNGSSILVSQNVPIDGNIAFYQDNITGAAVKMTCVGLSLGVCDMSLEGSFYYDNVEYGFSPKLGRDKRSIGTRRKKFYSVHKVKRAEPSVYDYKDAGQDRNISLTESIFNAPRLTALPMRRRPSRVMSRHKTSFKKHLKMGLIVIVDYSIYQRWYRMSRMLTPAEKDMDAKFKIRQYLAHVINGVDLRYNTLKNFEISIVVTSYIIADRESASVWTTNRYTSEPRDLLYADAALDKLVQWRYYMEHELPVHDHTMLFTGHDLYRPSIENTGVAGFARVRSMCTPLSVSVVEDHGGFSSILTATHELGHSLGALHDGHNNTCSGHDNFIMTPIGGGSSSSSNAANPFRFSSCSEKAFEKFLKSLSPGNCLTDEPEVYDMAEFQSHMRTEAGQIYGPNDQCIQHLGSHSYYAWGGVLGEISEICTHMACKNDQSSSSFNIYYAARGTSCGNKKWCIEGVCTPSHLAPLASDECVHGDSWRRFGNMTCDQYVHEDPSRCYYSFYSKFCCIGCGKLKRNIKGCEYGDRKKACKTYIQSASDCYDDNNDKICCDTCHRLHKGIKGCEYGDRFPECEATKCDKPEYSKQCCATCSSTREQNTVKRLDNRPRKTPSLKRIPTPSAQLITLSPLLAVTPKPPKRKPLFPELRVGSIGTKSRQNKHNNRHLHRNNPVRRKNLQKVSKGFPQNGRRQTHAKTNRRGHPKNKNTFARNKNTHINKRRSQRKNNKLQITKSKTNARKAEQTKNRLVGRQNVPKVHGLPIHSPRGRSVNNKHQNSIVDSKNSKTSTTGHKNSILSKQRTRKQTLSMVNQNGWKKCLKKEANLFGISCAKYSETICSIALLGGMCCEICPSKALAEAECTDKSECSATRGFDCYRQEEKNRCCSTCERFRTGISGCEYGDKIQICELLIRIVRDSTCKIASQSCCYSCHDSFSKKQVSNANIPSVNDINNFQNRNKARILPVRNPSDISSTFARNRPLHQSRHNTLPRLTNGLFTPINNIFVSSQNNLFGRNPNVRNSLPWNLNAFQSPMQENVLPQGIHVSRNVKLPKTSQNKQDTSQFIANKLSKTTHKKRKNTDLKAKDSNLTTTNIGIGDINILQTINFYNNAQNRQNIGMSSGVNSSPDRAKLNLQKTSSQKTNNHLNNALIRLLTPLVRTSLPLQRVALPVRPQHSHRTLWFS